MPTWSLAGRLPTGLAPWARGENGWRGDRAVVGVPS